MENSEEATPVRGLIDGRIMAEMTGQSLPNIRVWVSRQAAGKGFPEWLPKPVGRLNGGAVWAAQDLDVELARASVNSVPARGPKPKKVGASDDNE